MSRLEIGRTRLKRLSKDALKELWPELSGRVLEALKQKLEAQLAWGIEQVARRLSREIVAELEQDVRLRAVARKERVVREVKVKCKDFQPG